MSRFSVGPDLDSLTTDQIQSVKIDIDHSAETGSGLALQPRINGTESSLNFSVHFSAIIGVVVSMEEVPFGSRSLQVSTQY